MQNPNCDNNKCCDEKGEVRLLPMVSGSTMIVCHACYEYEMKYRHGRNRVVGRDAYKLPSWESLRVYEGE